MIDDLSINLIANEPPTDGHNVTFEYSGATEYGDFSLGAVTDALAQLDHELRTAQPAVELLKTAGGKLFDQLLGGRLYRAYTRAVPRSSERDHKLRIRIHSDQPALINIPWEYLYDGDQQQWLALHPQVSLVRGLPLQRQAAQPVNDVLRVLVMLSNPSDLPTLNSSAELASLQQAETSGRLDLLRIDPTYAALQSALRQYQPHVFHFVGHGAFSSAAGSSTEQAGQLAFCSQTGQAEMIAADRLAPLLAGSESLRLVVLNACEGAMTGQSSAFAGLTQQLIQQQIPAIIAMQTPIVDDHAVRFSQEFYGALAAGRSVEEAVAEGRKGINEVAHTWGVPAFYLQTSQPFAIQPLPAGQRADLLWQKAQKVADAARKRQLLSGALALVANHAGAQAGLARLQTEEEASHLYAAAVTYMEQQAWRDAQRALEQIEKRLPNFRDTRSRLSEVLGKLPAPELRATATEIAQAEQYLPIRNALLEGRLTFFLGDGVNRIGRPAGDHWVAGLYPPSAEDAARSLAQYLPLALQGEALLQQVSQYTALHEDKWALFERLDDLYRGAYTPTMLHRLLAELPARLAAKGYPKVADRRYVLFTTALDELLERAFDEVGQPFHLFAYRPRWVGENGITKIECFLHTPPTTQAQTNANSEPIEVLKPNDYAEHSRDNHPIIIKLRGQRVTSEPDSVVVTEDHYFNYLLTENSAALPKTLLSQIKPNKLLFFGHSLQPWHLRLLWQRLRMPVDERQPRRWAIVNELNSKEELFWRSQRIEPLVAQLEGVVAYVNDWVDSL